MNRIATLPYDELKFFWVNSHYDIHLSGLCKIGNTIFYFKTINSNESVSYTHLRAHETLS
jgi:hypothetical protein